jgi:hypothetical protein
MREAEAPLITEAEGEEGRGFRGSTSAGGGCSGAGRGGRQYQRRSDALAYGDRYQKAAALVDLVGSRSASRLSRSPFSASLSEMLCCFAATENSGEVLLHA